MSDLFLVLNLLLELLNLAIEPTVNHNQLIGLITGLVSVHQISVKLISQLFVLIRQGHLLLHKDLDIILQPFALSELLKQLFDLPLLQVDGLVSGINLNLNFFQFLEQVKDAFVLLLQVEVEFDYLVFQFVYLLLNFFRDVFTGCGFGVVEH